jgi:hypothetical protein
LSSRGYKGPLISPLLTQTDWSSRSASFQSSSAHPCELRFSK